MLGINELSIFVSYSHEDLKVIDKIIRFISSTKPKLSFWLDRNKLRIGDHVPNEIRYQIERASDFYLIFLSNQSLASEWVREEFSIARAVEKRQRRKFIIPAVLDPKVVDREDAICQHIAKILYVKLEMSLRVNSMAERLSDRILEQYSAEFSLLRKKTYNITGNERVRVFTDRNKLPPIEEALKLASTFDMLAFSARILKENWTAVEAAVRRGLKIRIAMFSPLEANKQYYDALEQILGERNEKAAELYNVLERVDRLRRSGPLLGSLEARLLSGKPLLHNLWVRDRGTPEEEGHVSFYAYGEMSKTPCFRSTEYSGDFVTALGKEFDVVWSLSQTIDLSAARDFTAS